MEQQKIKNLFTVNCGIGNAPAAPVFKKRSLIVWIMPWHWIIIPLLRFLKKKSYESALAAWKEKLAKVQKELHEEYDKEVTKLITEPASWDDSEMEIINAWGDKIEEESHHALTKAAMMTIYRSKLFKKVLEKTGYSVEEVSEHAPSFIWGYDFENGWYDTLKGDSVASIVSYRFFLYSPKQLIIASCDKDYYNQKETVLTEEFFYKHVAGIKTLERTVTNKNTKKEVTTRSVQLNSAGDKANFPIVGADAESQVKCIKSILNSKLD